MGTPILKRPFDIPDVPNWVPRRVKPWLFVFFVLIIQFSGGIYLASASQMVGTTALMQEDILMAGYAQLIGMSLNFAVMFRMKFRFSNRDTLVCSGIIMFAATMICSYTDNPILLTAICFVEGWIRMQATLACNSTIQLWITPVRDMSIFFCYVYLLVDGVVQLSGLASVYSAFFWQWEYMNWIMAGLLLLMIAMVLIFVRQFKGPMRIPLLGIDWLGSILWAVFMLCFAFVCVYGDFYDWWDAPEIRFATLLGLLCVALNLWRATFLRHPFISFPAMRNKNVVRAVIIHTVFFTLLATEHVLEHSYAEAILGFDETNLIDLNWYVLVGIAFGAGFTYMTFALRKWKYKTMNIIGFSLAALYLAYFYFTIDYGVEKEALFLPLFCRGAASVIIATVLLTSIVQSGLPFSVFPQALTINGFAGAVMGATFGPAVVGELLRHFLAENVSLISARFTDFYSGAASHMSLTELMGMVQRQALVVSMKEIYGLLLIVAICSLLILSMYWWPVRPWAIFPKWSKIRRLLRHIVRIETVERADSRAN